MAKARASADSQHRLLTVVFVIAAATTAILSLDATVVLLTPVVLATVRALVVPARVHAYATAHLANSASLLFPVSNLTNLLAFAAAGMTFLQFTAVMTLPWLAAIVVEFVLLRWLFGRDLSVKPRPDAVPGTAEVPVFILVVLAATLIGVNVGPNLTYSGSLANLLWRSVVHRAGIPAGSGEFTRVGACTVPLTLVASVVCLWAGVRLFGV